MYLTKALYLQSPKKPPIQKRLEVIKSKNIKTAMHGRRQEANKIHCTGSREVLI
jgi:hypothetical protein